MEPEQIAGGVKVLENTGFGLTVISKAEETVLEPQALLPTTLTFPDVANEVIETVILLVPCPDKIVTPDGTLQV